LLLVGVVGVEVLWAVAAAQVGCYKATFLLLETFQ
jgi:hypothetical protein